MTKTPQTRSGILPTPVSLFARQATLRFEEGTPPWKTVFQTDWTRARLGGTFRVTGYGDVLAPGATEATDLELGVGVVVDVEARYALNDRLTLRSERTMCWTNIPAKLSAPTTHRALPLLQLLALRFNGRFVYGRIALNW